MPDGPTPRPGAVRRLLAWATATRLRTACAASAVLLAATVVALAIGFLARPPEPTPATLEAAFEALDRRAYAEAKQLAEQVRDQGALPASRRGDLALILGMVAMREADDSVASNKAPLYLAAARLLEEADRRGFPPEREAEGLFALGRCLYLGGRIAASRPVLLEALAAGHEHQTEIHLLLAEASLSGARPNLAEALRHNEQYLNEPRLSAEERFRGLAQQAHILLQLGRAQECLKVVEQIPDSADNRAEAIVIRARLHMDLARRLRRSVAPADQPQARQEYQAAVQLLRQVKGRDTLQTQVTGKSEYLIGQCLLEMGDARAALAQFTRTRTLVPDSPEGQAASLQEAELRRRSGRNVDALASYQRVLNSITQPDDYSNPWIPWNQLQARLLGAYQEYLAAQQYEVCLKLASMLSPAFPPTKTAELAAEAHRAWGRDLVRRAEHLAPGQAQPLAQAGREQLRKAGRAYAQLAALRPASRQYPDDLWQSAVCSFDGQDYRHAARQFSEYLRVETRRRQASALVYLGEALLSLGRTDEALAALEECLDLHPRDPVVFKARLLASDAWLEKNAPKQAEALLRENLGGETLTPASNEWRDSLFALGRLLHGSRRFEEAIRVLDEAVQRYPDAPRAAENRYLMAESYRRHAETIREKLQSDLGESRRAAYAKTAREWLGAALAQYERVQELLSHGRESPPLAPSEKTLLRNCQFAAGKVLFDLGQYEAAVKVYSTIIHQYPNAPEVLEAYMQIARARQRMNQSAEARAALEQAKRVLERMAPEAPFTETTRCTRQEWSELLAKLTAS